MTSPVKTIKAESTSRMPVLLPYFPISHHVGDTPITLKMIRLSHHPYSQMTSLQKLKINHKNTKCTEQLSYKFLWFCGYFAVFAENDPSFPPSVFTNDFTAKLKINHKNTKYTEQLSCKFLWFLWFCGYFAVFTVESQKLTEQAPCLLDPDNVKKRSDGRAV